MAISVKWHDKFKTIIVTHFQDPWTIEEFLEIRKKWHRMIKNVTYSVPIIMDLSESYDPPKHVLRHFLAIHRTPHPRQGHIIVVGMNPTYKKLSIHLFDGVVESEKTVKFADTLEDAVALTAP